METQKFTFFTATTNKNLQPGQWHFNREKKVVFSCPLCKKNLIILNHNKILTDGSLQGGIVCIGSKNGSKCYFRQSNVRLLGWRTRIFPHLENDSR